MLTIFARIIAVAGLLLASCDGPGGETPPPGDASHRDTSQADNLRPDAGAVHAEAGVVMPGTPCGDGICDPRERREPALCPADCASATSGRVEEIHVMNPSSGVSLYGHLHLPADASTTKQYPAVVLVPGGTGSGDGFDATGLASRFVDQGIIALHFDLDGRGQSAGTEDQCGTIHQDGLEAVGAYLASRAEVRVGGVGLLSQSFGVTCATGTLARHKDKKTFLFLVDFEGPADRNDTGHCDASNTGHITHDCQDDAWWSAREAATSVKSIIVPYLRVQTGKDHAQPDNSHAILMINSATSGQFGGGGVSPWTLVNDETLNQPNRVYSAAAPPKWLAAGGAPDFKTQKSVESVEAMLER